MGCLGRPVEQARDDRRGSCSPRAADRSREASYPWGSLVTIKDSERAQVTRVTRRFAKNLVALRRQSGLSQERVASRSGLHRTEISLLERGLRVPRLNTIVRLAGGVDR